MRALLYLLIFLAALAGGAYWVQQTIPPARYAGYFPNAIVPVALGGTVFYFPPKYIVPHYPNNHYDAHVEGSGWSTLDKDSFAFLPFSQRDPDAFNRIDVIITSDKVPTIKGEVDEYRALAKRSKPAGKNKLIKLEQYNGHETYIGTDIHVACEKDHCTLLSARRHPVVIYLFFPKDMLSRWSDILDAVEKQVTSCRQQPKLFNYLLALLPFLTGNTQGPCSAR